MSQTHKAGQAGSKYAGGHYRQKANPMLGTKSGFKVSGSGMRNRTIKQLDAEIAKLQKERTKTKANAKKTTPKKAKPKSTVTKKRSKK